MNSCDGEEVMCRQVVPFITIRMHELERVKIIESVVQHRLTMLPENLCRPACDGLNRPAIPQTALIESTPRRRAQQVLNIKRLSPREVERADRLGQSPGIESVVPSEG